MNVYKAQSSITKKFFRSRSRSKSVWDSAGNLRKALAAYSYRSDYTEWRKQWVIKEYELVEVSLGS